MIALARRAKMGSVSVKTSYSRALKVKNFIMDTTRLSIGFALIALSLFCGCVLGYYGIQFYRLRYEMVMIKRYCDIVVILILLAMFALFIGFPFTIFVDFSWSLAPEEGSKKYLIMGIVNDWLWNPSMFFSLFLGMLRLWLLFYDIEFSSSMSNVKWKQIITTNMTTLRRDQWFIAHRKGLGNKRYLMKWAIGCAAVISVATITNSYLEHWGYTDIRGYVWVAAVLYVLALLIILVLFLDMPHFDDIFCVHREFQILSCCSAVGITSYIINETIRHIIGDPLWIQTNQFVIWIYGSFTIPFISSFWVLRQIRMTGLTSPRSIPSSDDVDAFGFPDKMEMGPIVTEKSGSKSMVRKRDSFKMPAAMEDILADASFLNQIAKHLVSELSTECLLSLIEFQQFKSHLIECLKIDDLSTKEIWFKLAESVPLSDIVHHEEQTDLKSFRRRARDLYEKYVMVDSDFEINIPDKMRRQLHSLMGNESKWMDKSDISPVNLANVFDGVMMEMKKLLKYSRLRFKEDEQ